MNKYFSNQKKAFENLLMEENLKILMITVSLLISYKVKF